MELFLKRGFYAVLRSSAEGTPGGHGSAGAAAGWQGAWQSHEGDDGSDAGDYDPDPGML